VDLVKATALVVAIVLAVVAVVVLDVSPFKATPPFYVWY
jgi:hypothetical protein